MAEAMSRPTINDTVRIQRGSGFRGQVDTRAPPDGVFSHFGCDVSGVSCAGPRKDGQAVVWKAKFVMLEVLLRPGALASDGRRFGAFR